MTRESLIRKTMENILKLPDNKLKEVTEFTEFLLQRIDDRLLIHGIKELTTESDAFKFLEDDEVTYSVNDLKERYK